MAMELKFRYSKEGSHYHCKLWSRHNVKGTFAQLSEHIVFDEKDFDALTSGNFKITIESKPTEKEIKPTATIKSIFIESENIVD